MEPTLYLFFGGNCLEAMTCYADILDGEIIDVTRNADALDRESRMPGGDDMVMNMSLRINRTVLMASDAPAEMYRPPQGIRVQVAPGLLAEFDRVFTALSEGAETIDMAPTETFWAERFTMFTDRYGTPWMLNFEGAANSREAS